MSPCYERHLGYDLPPPQPSCIYFNAAFLLLHRAEANIGWIGVKINVLMNP